MQRAMHKAGFTIVELLIVIVVIGILAAVVIVAYNGIQNKARIASLQAGLNQSAQQLEVWKLSNSDRYPADFSTAQTQGLLKGGNGMTFDATHYIVNNGVSPAAYCASAIASDGVTTYAISSVNMTPMTGECITNWAPNAGAEGSTVALVTSTGSGTISRSADTFSGWPTSGSESYKVAASTTSDYIVRPPSNVMPRGDGTDVTVSVSIYNATTSSRTIQLSFQGRTAGGSAIGTTVGVQGFIIGPGSWQRVSDTIPASVWSGDFATAAYIEPRFGRVSSGGSAANDVFYVDDIVLNSGTKSYSFADGRSTGWFWNGDVDNSASTGPAIVNG